MHSICLWPPGATFSPTSTPAVGESLECEAASGVGFSSVLASLTRPQCTQVPRAQAKWWVAGIQHATHTGPKGSAQRHGGWASTAVDSSTGKGRAQFLCWGWNQDHKHPIKSPLPAPQSPSGGVPSCCSPGRVPCTMRAASPRGRPCPPFWGRRAGGTGGIEGTAPADMAGGTPRRTCRGQGTQA